jgi:hypothetical protein
MSCNCNSKRQNLQTSSSSSAPAQSSSKFRYIGASSMTVTGGVTRQVYRFPNPGAEVLIDGRDVPGMFAIPNVERVGY